ncbi:MAG: DUF3089 domain-containing protein [Kiritimatiellae bacterium]|nr:DUF3089 domain-containing protein [Kiritimatiellia bacterium]
MKLSRPRVSLKVCVVFSVLVISLSCEQGNATEATDYSIAAHWLTVPATTNKAVDVFYFYPTAWSNNDSFPVICDIDNASMLIQAPEASALQVTAFEPIGNIYTPFYRQDNLSPTDRLNIIAGIPTLDATAAFDYYIKHYNHGRPFILAGHSQGSDVLSNLLAGYMKDNPAVLVRMIAAYVIGFPITAEYLANNPHLKFAEGPGDTGVIISYNTQSPDVVPPVTNPVLSGLIGVVINPITWTRDETLATTNQGVGSFMPDTNGVYARVPQYADARIDISNGVLICSTADTNALGRINTLARFGIYHNFDYPFYYFNIRSNAANRIQNYLNKVCFDYDGDGKADPAAYQDGQLIVAFSSSGYWVFGATMGGPGGIECSADFDGDGQADPAVYNPTTRLLSVLFSSRSYALGGMSMGGDGCVPVVGDFDGDCKADPALYVASPGLVVAWLSNAGYSNAYAFSASLGGAGWLNASADYDGDGKTDPAVFEPASGKWQVLLSGQGYASYGWPTTGGAGVVPVPGDYDGDGKADLMVYQPAGGLWMCTFSAQGYTTTGGIAGFGGPTMGARGGDYDNDGKADPAVYDPVTRSFYVRLSGSGYRLVGMSW